MSKAKMNQQFEIPLEQIEETIGAHINGDHTGYKTVVSPKSILKVDALSSLEKEVLEKMVRKIPLSGHPDVYPYANSGIKVFERSPVGHEIGQTFIHKEKLIGIMQNLEGNVLRRFDTPGFAHMPATKIYGTDSRGQKVVGFYIPPFLEIHGTKVVLIDGIHRSYLTKSVGSSMRSIHLTKVEADLPFTPIEWEEASVVNEKPPIEQRYQNLRRDLFRNLGAIGVDG